MSNLSNPTPARRPTTLGGRNSAAWTSELQGEAMRLQFGPSHPATHGTVRIMLELDGEHILGADVQVGYLHRGFEKECESGYYYQAIPYVDRTNYSSPLLCDLGYCMAVEKLFDLTIPLRGCFVRVIAGELSRMADHQLAIGAACLELAAMTPFLYLVEARELLWDLLDALCGSRVTTNYIRIGGVAADLPAGFAAFCTTKLDQAMKLVDDAAAMLTESAIFRGRMEGTGHLPADQLIALGVSGPLLRAAGVGMDLRRSQPYLVYDQLEFAVPIGRHGDNFDRYLVRLEELRQSRSMIVQCLERLPEGPVDVDDTRIRWPGKNRVFNRMEELIDQFLLVVRGGQPPAGEVYHAIEGSNGEYGFYLVSDGSGKPFKCRLRGPSFSNMQALGPMIVNRQLADIIPTFDMINMIGDECDK